MKVSKLEKRLVNRVRRGQQNIPQLRTELKRVDRADYEDALELGCGIGTVSDFLAHQCGMRVCGTDSDPEQIKAARHYYAEDKNLQFQVEAAANLSFPDAMFDLVVSQNVFHHIPEWENVVTEVACVLRPGGGFIWNDIAASKPAKALLGPLLRKCGVYTVNDMREACAGDGMLCHHRERQAHGPFGHHGLIMQKTESRKSVLHEAG